MLVVSVHNEKTLLVEHIAEDRRHIHYNIDEGEEPPIEEEIFSKKIWLRGSSISVRFGLYKILIGNAMCFYIERSDSNHSPNDYILTLPTGENVQLNEIIFPNDISSCKIGCDNYSLDPLSNSQYNLENDLSSKFEFLITFKNGWKFDKNFCLYKRLLIVSDVNYRSDYYDKGIGLDFTIMVGENVIKSSKFVLGFYSVVFEAMFQNDCKESHENIVHIEDVEYEVMLMMVKVLHNVPVALDEVRTSLKLLIVADKYNVDCIKDQLISHIKDDINDSNVVNVLTIAHQLNIDEMKENALDFITSNKYQSIEDLAGYNRIPTDVALLVLKEMRKKLLCKDQ